MSDIVSEIKSRLSIEDVVSQYVQLKQAGKNFKGLCPFHQEKTPSFMVSPEKQLAYCFGCHKGGDIIAFVEEVEGVEFKEAVEILADKCGIDTKDYKLTDSKHSKSEKEYIIDIHSKAADFYEDKLWNSNDGAKVLDYLRNRGLKDDTIRKYKFGLAPDSFEETHMFLVKKGFDRKMLSLGGVAVSKDTDSQKVYDRFRRRLMIPIFDSIGRIVAFGGRALKKDDEPKYLNSPDSPIYKKSEVVYGYNFAKDAIKKTEKVILTEGYFDVIMSHQEGIMNTVATSGTALTAQQIALFKRLTKDLIFCFDTDKAGIEAAKRGFELAQSAGMNVSVLTGLDTKDPADYIKDHPGKWSEFVQKPIPFMDFSIIQSKKDHDISNMEEKKRILNELLPYLRLLTSSFEKDYYIRKIAQELETKEVTIYDELKKKSSINVYSNHENQGKSRNEEKKLTGIEIVFGLIIEHPDTFEDKLKQINIDLLTEHEKSIYNSVKDHYNLLRAEDKRKDFLSCFNVEIADRLKVISLFIDDFYGEFTREMLEKELKILLDNEKKVRIERMQRSLSVQIKEAEKAGDKEKTNEFLSKIKNLMSI